MSYLVLARKWRPGGFEDLVGQESISRILTNAIGQGRIAHAYLFSGPKGVGKTTTARILAKALNCEQGPTGKPCGACISCTGIADGSSMDVTEIDGASNNSVNDIRELREHVKYAPAGGKYKIYIIDEAHMLSDAAFNALLKTLEEPPPHVIFVLATTASRKIPATVLSRCQHLPFRRIQTQRIKERLSAISASEGIKISGAALEMIARAADGSMRDSLTILDQLSAFSSDIGESEVKDLLGIADFTALSDLAVSVIRGDRKGIICILNELANKGTDLRSFSKDLMNFLRDLLVAKVVSRPEDMLDYSENEASAIKEILGQTSEDQLTILLGEMIKAESEARSAFSPRIALEAALVRMSFFNALKPLNDALAMIESFVGGSAGRAYNADEAQGAAKTPERATAPDAAVKYPESKKTPQASSAGEFPDDSTNDGGINRDGPDAASLNAKGNASVFWNAAMKMIESKNHLLACKLAEASSELRGNTLFVIFNGGSAIYADAAKDNQRMIETVVSGILGRNISVKVESAKKKTDHPAWLREQILSEPIVREAIELFEGRIVDVRQAEKIENGGNDVKKNAW